MKWNEVRTRVALSSSASASPTRIDNSFVANANNCIVRRELGEQQAGRDRTERIRAFARGMMPMKETVWS
jgi:hypothetical protein